MVGGWYGDGRGSDSFCRGLVGNDLSDLLTQDNIIIMMMMMMPMGQQLLVNVQDTIGNSITGLQSHVIVIMIVCSIPIDPDPAPRS